jgi:hypothetical protein
MMKTKGDVIFCILIAAFFSLVGYFYGIGVKYDKYTKRAFEELRQQYVAGAASKKSVFQSGPFWFERKNPYLYSVTLFDPRIAGIESTERKR